MPTDTGLADAGIDRTLIGGPALAAQRVRPERGRVGIFDREKELEALLAERGQR